MSPDLLSFVILSLNSSMSVVTTNGTLMPLVVVGSIVTHYMSLSDVYQIHNLALNLVSISRLCESGYLVFFSFSICYV